MDQLVYQRWSTDGGLRPRHTLLGEGAWALTDRGHNVVLLQPDTPTSPTQPHSLRPELAERVRYTAYGLPRVEEPADFTTDGKLDQSDLTIFIAATKSTVGDASYRADADFDADGDVDLDDYTLFQKRLTTGVAPQEGLLSLTMGNPVGFGGSLYDPVSQHLLMRHRWYEPRLGRFITRDPAGYVDGLSLYIYGSANLFVYFDPMGLYPQELMIERNGDWQTLNGIWDGLYDRKWDFDEHEPGILAYAAGRVGNAVERVADVAESVVAEAAGAYARSKSSPDPLVQMSAGFNAMGGALLGLEIAAPDTASVVTEAADAYSEAAYGTVGAFTGGIFDSDYGLLGFKDEVLGAVGHEEGDAYRSGTNGGRTAIASGSAAGGVSACLGCQAWLLQR